MGASTYLDKFSRKLHVNPLLRNVLHKDESILLILIRAVLHYGPSVIVIAPKLLTPQEVWRTLISEF